jgi:excinuclease ABC subunit C
LQPDLILIDGGIAQLKTAISVFANNKNFKNILLGSLAKGKKQLLVYQNQEIIYHYLSKLSPELANLLKAIQDESHRFAISYHHKLYLKELKNDQ